MRIELHVFLHDASDDSAVLIRLHEILHGVKSIMASNADLLAALNTVNDNVTAIGTEVDKIGTETTGLQKSVADLTAALAAGGGTTPEVDAALAAVQANTTSLAARVKAVDDLVPDSPVTP